MPLFGYKNNSEEYMKLESFVNNCDSLLATDSFISVKAYFLIYESISELINKLKLMEDEQILSEWCKKQKTDYKKLTSMMAYYDSFKDKIKKHNDNFVSKHLRSEKEYLDKILEKDDPNILLDEEQRKVVLRDEDYTLVIAGAGAGKTTTIEAKVKYLVEKLNIDPDKILIVSFTKKATKELQDRFNKLEIPVDIATFHSIGNTIIKENEETRHQIVSNGFMFDVIKDYLMNKVDDESFIKKIVLFFASYLNIPFDEENTALLFKQFKQDNNTTLKSDLATILDNYQKEQTKNRKTLNDERVRSIDECRIANFLFINGIEYEYEPVYKYCFKGTIKPYCPDFLIKQYGKEIYLEHFGITQDGRNNRFTEAELEEYKKHINDKVKLHKEHGTKLIYTFSRYNDGRDVIEHLKEELIKAGISLEAKTDREIYKQIAKNAEDKYFNKFIQLVCTFISRFKVNNFTPSKFDEWKITLTDERTKLFIDICYQCYLVYMQALKQNKAIDFEDMINNASNVLDKRIESKDYLEYEYIFVDEYQDISLQRFDLCEKLSKYSNAKIVAVGDDWQSIFRFSGAKIDLFTKFEEKMGYADILKITKTYRNSQELIDIAGKFVMSNDNQIKKDLKSNKSINDPVILMSYDDSYEKDEANNGPFYRLGEAIEKSLDQIVQTSGENKNVLLIGRFGFDGRNLSKLEDLFEYYNGKVVSKKYPKLSITYLTAHSSKGLGYDNVIIINGKDDIMGFPSKIEDDPVMRLVIKEDESIDFAEKRRLFYVALTRTKNRVYIITPQHRPSKFITEIKDKFTNVILRGVKLDPVESLDLRIKCPYCGYPLQRRKNKNFKFANSIWICSNDPEVCGFMTNDLKGGRFAISKCPECEDGYLVVKPIKDKSGKDTGARMLGCTNYKKDGTGCSCHMNMSDFTQNKEQLDLRFYNENSDINNIQFMGVPFIKVVNAIIDILDYYTNSGFKLDINPKLLFAILSGESDNKVVIKFRLSMNRNFGMIESQYNKKFYALLNELKANNIVAIDEDNYNAVKLLRKNLTDEDYKIVLSGLYR